MSAYQIYQTQQGREPVRGIRPRQGPESSFGTNTPTSVRRAGGERQDLFLRLRSALVDRRRCSHSEPHTASQGFR